MCALFMYVLAREADDDLKMEFLVYRQHGRNLILEPTDEAKRIELQNKSHSGTFRAHHPEAVESDARARIRNLHMPAAEVCPAGLETVSPQAVLAYSVLQFGKYRGQTFKWVLENAMGWAVGFVRSYMHETGNGSALGVNKERFSKFA